MINCYFFEFYRYFLKFSIMIFICLLDLFLEIYFVKVIFIFNFESWFKVIIVYFFFKNLEKFVLVVLYRIF